MSNVEQIAKVPQIKTKKKVAIVGGALSWKDAPYDDKSWEIWILGNQVRQYDHKRVDLIFEIHEDLDTYGEGYAQALFDLKFPMVVSKKFPYQADHIEVFDFDKARDFLGGDYLTSTPAHMMAYAMYSRPDIEEIGVWGCDMAVDDKEYFYEQPVMKEWIGFCKGKGIKVSLPDGSPLGPPSYIEGVDGIKPEGLKPYTEEGFLAMSQTHIDEIAKIDEKIEQLRALRCTHDGGRQVYEKLAQVARATDAGQVFKDLTHTMRTIKNG